MGKNTKKEKPFNAADLKPEEKLKFEIAAELGLADKVTQNGWRSQIGRAHV